tara:strand:- start:338 stop:508 length:171 start_codon:yes stop_codon:yes gene_type:complete
MPLYTVKVTESYFFYDVEADDSAEAEQIIANYEVFEEHDSDDYSFSIESELNDYNQ